MLEYDQQKERNMNYDRKYERDENRISISKDEFNKLSDKAKLTLILSTAHGRNLFRKSIKNLLDLPLEPEPYFPTMYSIKNNFIFVVGEKEVSNKLTPPRSELTPTSDELDYAVAPLELEKDFHEILKEIIAKKENKPIIVDAIKELNTQPIVKKNAENAKMEMER